MWWISYRGDGKSGVENIGVFEDDGTPRQSVRGIIVHGDHLHVADEAGNAVSAFTVSSGGSVARIKGGKLTKPVHLILHEDTLYIGAAGTGSILAFGIPENAPTGKLKARTFIDGLPDVPGFLVHAPEPA